VCLSFGYAAETMALAGAGDGRPAALLKGENFAAAIKQADPDGLIVGFADVAGLLGLLQDAVEREGDANVSLKVTAALEASGLVGVRHVVYSGGFVGRDWRERAFVAAAAPRKGLVSIFESKPFDETLLARVPASATTFSASRLDLAKFVATLGKAIDDTDKRAGDLFRKALGGATMAVGKSIETDVLPPMGDEWVFYTSPDVGENGLLGTVAVSKPKNALKAKQALLSLSLFASNSSKTALRGKDFKIEGRSTQIGDVTVYYVATPFVAPSWATKDGFLYAGASPQIVAAAAMYAGEGIAASKAYTEGMKSLEVTQPVSLRFIDVPTLLPRGHSSLTSIVRLGLGLSDMFAAPAAEPVVPLLPTFRRESAPSVSAMWADDAGIYFTSRESFPGASQIAQLSIEQLMMPNPLLAGSILLPSLNRSREAANRIKSASNLRQLGLACIMYANENRGKYPPSIGEVIRTQDVTAAIFANPRAEGNGVPPLPPGAKPEEFLPAWAEANSDYVYVGARLTSAANADAIVAYESPEGLEDGINVLFADGHVDFVSFAGVPQVFAKGGTPAPAVNAHGDMGPAH
jgi:prepilin-type processing-associated H-X9-DG protein